MKPVRYYEFDKPSNSTYIYDDPIIRISQSVSILFNTNVEQARKMYSMFLLKPVWTVKEN